MQTSKAPVTALTRYRALPIIAEGMAAERGYRIEYVEKLSFSVSREKKIIYLPKMSVIGSDDDAVCIEGGLDHELMHTDQTDPALRIEERAIHRLWNVIEDPRGEKGFFLKYPGCAHNVERTLDVLARRGGFSVPPADRPFQVLCAFLLFELRAGILGQTAFCSNSRKPTSVLARKLFGKIADECLSIAQEVVLHERGRPGSYKALDAARKIYSILAGEPPPPSQQDQPAQDQSGSSPQQGDEGDRSGQQEDGAPTDDASSGNGARPGEQQGDASKGVSPAGVTAEQAATAHKAFVDAQTNDGPYGQGLEAQIVGPHGLDVENRKPVALGELYESNKGLMPSPDLRVKNLSDANSVTLALSLQLEDLLISFGKSEERYARSGRFDSSRVVRAACGNRRIYTRSQVSEELNTAISLLIDCSGSMAGRSAGEPVSTNHRRAPNGRSRMEIANAAAIALATALDRYDVPFSVLSFNSITSVVHAFDASWQRTLGLYSVSPDGTTRMGEAFLHATRGLIHRQEARRIILLVTDGEPSNWDLLETAIQEAKQWGIETRVVLIASRESVRERFAKLRCAPSQTRSINEIPRAIFKALENALTE